MKSQTNNTEAMVNLGSDYIKDFPITASLISAMKEPYCERKLIETKLRIDSKERPNLNMLKGLFFESLCLGESSDGSVTKNLPRLKTGKKSIDQIRIEIQADNFKKVCDLYKIKVLSVQLEVKGTHKATTRALMGHIDIVGTIEEEVIQPHSVFDPKPANYQEKKIIEVGCIIDLKLTANINAGGDWSWKHPYNMPSTQPAMYTRLMEENLSKTLPFYYMVFDYSTAMDFVIIKKNIGILEQSELDVDIKRVSDTLDDMHNNSLREIKYHPTYQGCMSCVLKTRCSHAILKKPIIVV